MAESFLREVLGEASGGGLAVREYAGGSFGGELPYEWADFIQPVRRGLPVRAFDVVCRALDVPRDRLARVVQVPMRTLARRTGLFKPDESERILRVGRLVERAREVLGSDASAQRWMTQPVRALGGAVPLDFADTEPGARAVEDVLGRLEHGVFS
jgi:putative toxin-antitoxin system antitoxin component (TIGR02293 family)